MGRGTGTGSLGPDFAGGGGAAAAVLVKKGLGAVVAYPQDFAGGGLGCFVGLRRGAPAQELAVGGVADVEAGVAVAGLEGEGAGDDGERFERLGTVGGAGFGGYYLLDVALDREGGDEEESAGLGGDSERVAEGEGFAVGGDAPASCEEKLGGLAGELVGFGPGERGVVCLEGEGFAGLVGAGFTELEGRAGQGCDAGGRVAVEGPEGDAEGGAGWGFGLGGADRAQEDEERNAFHGSLSGDWARMVAARWAACLPWPAGR